MTTTALFRKRTKYRRNLLPLWIKIFIWIFLSTGIIVPVFLLLEAFGLPSQLAIYGLESSDMTSLLGLSLTGIFILKGIVAYGLWFGKDWAIIFGQIDGIIGIVFCVILTMIPICNRDTGFYPGDIRIEIFIIIPYLIKITKIKKEWFDEKRYSTYLEV
jgi:hypothetical protein